MTHHLATFQSKTETKRIIYMDLHFLQSEGRKSSKPTPPYVQNFENLWRQNRQKWEKPMAIPKCAKDLLKLTDCWCSCKGNSCGLSFLKNGPVPASFCLFSLFSRYNFNNTNWKKLRWCAWDSNPGPQDGWRRRNHGAMAATREKTPLPNGS